MAGPACIRFFHDGLENEHFNFMELHLGDTIVSTPIPIPCEGIAGLFSPDDTPIEAYQYSGVPSVPLGKPEVPEPLKFLMGRANVIKVSGWTGWFWGERRFSLFSSFSGAARGPEVRPRRGPAQDAQAG